MATRTASPLRLRRHVLVAFAVAVAVGLPGRWALASEPPAATEPPATTKPPAPRAPAEPGATAPPVPLLAWVATAVPGVLVHGSGHFVAGRRDTAARLLAMEGAGVGLFLVGGVPLVLTGASRYFVAPAAASVIFGVGLFGISFFSDIYGLAAPEGGTGAPLRLAPLVESRLGYAYVYDPQFSYRHFAVTGADLRIARIRLSPEAWIAPGGRNERLRLEAAYRLAGPLPDRRARDGSLLDVETALTHHVFPREGFSTTTVELALGGRLDFARLDRRLRGSFAEMSLGAAVERVEYELPGAPAEGDTETLLLARFAYGFYLGGPGHNAGELRLYYDHRHDDFAAGLQMSGLGSGVAGHFGLSGELFAGRLGVGADVAAGSAYVATLSLLYRHTEGP